MVGIPKGTNRATCPLRSLQLWLMVAGVSEGPILRRVDRHGNVPPDRLSAHAVALVVQARAAAYGLVWRRPPRRLTSRSRGL